MKINRLYLLAFLFTGLSVSAQVTITYPDFGKPGDSLVYAVDTTISTPVNIGSAGPGQSWDFSADVTPDFYDHKLILDGTANPTAPQGTNITVLSSFSGEQNYQIDSLAASILVPNPLGLGAAIKFRIADFPMAIGKDFRDSSRVDFKAPAASLGIPITGIDTLWFKVDIVNVVNCDAWGALKTPAGTKDVLRVRNKTYQKIRVSGKGVITFGQWIDVTGLMAGTGVPLYTSTFMCSYLANNARFYVAQASTDSLGNILDMEYMVPGVPVVPTGLNSASIASELAVYPNPANEELNIEGICDGAMRIEVTDLTGKVVLVSDAAAHGKMKLNTASLNNGVYFCSITRDGLNVVRKIIISH